MLIIRLNMHYRRFVYYLIVLKLFQFIIVFIDDWNYHMKFIY